MISSLENVVADILKPTSFERIVKKLSIYSNNKSIRKRVHDRVRIGAYLARDVGAGGARSEGSARQLQ